MNRCPLFTLSLALICLWLAAPARAVMITDLQCGYDEFVDPATGSGFYMFANVDTSIGGPTTRERYYHPNGGIFSLAVMWVETVWRCALYPDDVPDPEFFDVPESGVFSFLAPSVYQGLFGPGYLVCSTSTGFTVRAGNLPKPSEPVSVPDAGGCGLALAATLGLLCVVRHRERARRAPVTGT